MALLGESRPQAQRGRVRPPPAQRGERQAEAGSRLQGCTHSMGFPLISDMMALSPPRYS